MVGPPGLPQARNVSGLALSKPVEPSTVSQCFFGKSTGPKTREGAERARQAALRHGFYTAEAKAERRIARAALVGLQAALAASQRTDGGGRGSAAAMPGGN